MLRRLGDLHVNASPKSTLVLGSLGPLVESYRADLIMSHKEGVAVYTDMARALSPYVDCFLGETMSCYEECIQVMDAVNELDSADVRPVMTSFTLDGQGNFRSGEAVVNGITRLLDYVKTRKQVECKLNDNTRSIDYNDVQCTFLTLTYAISSLYSTSYLVQLFGTGSNHSSLETNTRGFELAARTDGSRHSLGCLRKQTNTSRPRMDHGKLGWTSTNAKRSIPTRVL